MTMTMPPWDASWFALTRRPCPAVATVLRPCLACGRPTRGARCPEHDHDNARRAAKAKAHGLTTRAWQLLRRARLELDGYRCRLALPGCTGRATSVHLRPEL